MLRAGPSVTRCVVARTSAAAMPPGGTTKSVALATLPAAVATTILPEPVAGGTANESDVVVTEDAAAPLRLSLTVVALAAGLKFVPLTVTTVPAAPDAG